MSVGITPEGLLVNVEVGTPPPPPPLTTYAIPQPSEEAAIGFPSAFGFFATQTGTNISNFGVPVDETINQ